MNIPNHIAIILDGNGRWAKAKGLPRNAGHAEGGKNMENVCRLAWNKGVKYLTVYAFSTENWSRPQDEVTGIMNILNNFMMTAVKKANKNNMKVRVIGDITGLSKKMQENIRNLEEKTKDNTGLNFQVAINYGGRDEIRRAIYAIGKDIQEGNLTPEDITEEIINARIDTAGIPDPDLLIRTCGEQRLSNFLLWQSAYTEFYFCPEPWPDFGEKQLDAAIEAYNKRDRKYGGIKEK